MDINVPGYWMNEASGQLRPVVEAYIAGENLTARDVAIIRVYLRQFITAPCWHVPMIDELRNSVDEITDRDGIARWIMRALDAGLDPL